MSGFFAFNTSLYDEFSLNIFQTNQQKGASLYGYASTVDPSLIGSRGKQAAVSPFSTNIPTSNNGSGLFGKMNTKYYAVVSVDKKTFIPTLAELQPSPWYNLTSGTPDDLDDAISAAIQTVIIDIARIDKSDLLGDNRTKANLVFAQVGEVLKFLPEGAVFFNKIDNTNLEYSFNLQYGSDVRVSASSNFPLPGPRQLYQQTLIDNSILRSVPNFENAQITQGLRILPFLQNTKFSFEFGGLIGKWIMIYNLIHYRWYSLSFWNFLSFAHLLYHFGSRKRVSYSNHDENEWNENVGLPLVPLHYLFDSLCRFIFGFHRNWFLAKIDTLHQH